MNRPNSLPPVTVPSTRTRQRLRSRDWPRMPRRDPHVRMMARLIELAGPGAPIIASSSRPWASATFIGAQHRVILRFEGEEAQPSATRFAESLPEAEFSISGHIVADACVDEWGIEATDEGESLAPSGQTSACPTLRVSILTVEDW